MFKFIIPLITFLLPTLAVYAQNLVINPSFEEYWQCPTQIANASDCKYVFNPQCVQEPAPCISTSDYFNSCASIGSNANVPYTIEGYQLANTGNGYLGFIFVDTMEYREYVQIKLSDPLSKGSIYPFSFHVNLANESHVATDAIGVKFVTDSVYYTNQYLWEIMTPDWVNEEGNYITDTMNWTKLSGDYISQGGEQWMIIGVFHQEKIVPSIIVNPAANPAWYNFSYYFIDDVTVDYVPLNIPNVFTPNGDNINDIWVTGGNVRGAKIFNRWGNVVFDADDNFQGWDGNNKNGTPCEEGVYFFVLYNKNPFKEEQKRYNGFITLLR